MREISERAGVSHATVSMALRNDPRISAATRRRIEKLAMAMGYQRDPRISELMQHLRRGKQETLRGVLAYLDFRTESLPVNSSLNIEIEAAKNQTDELGYDMQVIYPRLNGLTDRRLDTMLESRGIRGILVGASPTPQSRLDLSWDRLAGVMMGHSLAHPLLDRITTHFFHAVSTAYTRLRELGLRRIGLVITEWHDLRTDRQIHAGFLINQQIGSRRCRVPVLTCPGRTVDKSALLSWARDHRPDGILLGSSSSLPVRWLRAAGIRIPADMSVAILDLKSSDGRFSGILQDPAVRARRGAEYLTMKLEANEFGIPLQSSIIQIEMGWIDGATTSHPPVRAR